MLNYTIGTDLGFPNEGVQVLCFFFLISIEPHLSRHNFQCRDKDT